MLVNLKVTTPFSIFRVDYFRSTCINEDALIILYVSWGSFYSLIYSFALMSLITSYFAFFGITVSIILISNWMLWGLSLEENLFWRTLIKFLKLIWVVTLILRIQISFNPSVKDCLLCHNGLKYLIILILINTFAMLDEWNMLISFEFLLFRERLSSRGKFSTRLLRMLFWRLNSWEFVLYLFIWIFNYLRLLQIHSLSKLFRVLGSIRSISYWSLPFNLACLFAFKSL